MEGITGVKDLQEALGVPARYLPTVVISVGHAAKPRADASKRYAFEKVFFVDKFENKTPLK